MATLDISVCDGGFEAANDGGKSAGGIWSRDESLRRELDDAFEQCVPDRYLQRDARTKD